MCNPIVAIVHYNYPAVADGSKRTRKGGLYAGAFGTPCLVVGVRALVVGMASGSNGGAATLSFARPAHVTINSRTDHELCMIE